MDAQPKPFEETTPARPLLLAAYAIAFVLVLLPIVETFGALWPPQPGSAGWRFGATGIFFTFLMTAPMGLLIAVAVASILRQRTVLRVLAGLSLAFAAAIAVLFGSFSLDFIQVRPMIQPRVKGGFDMTAAKATVTAILALVACMILAVAGFRESRELTARGARRARPDRAKDVVIGRR